MTRAAIVGLGQAAAFAIEGLRSVPGIELVCAVDPRGSAAPAAEAGTTVHRSLGEMGSAGLDLVIVATPTDTHVPICRDLLTRSNPTPRLLCEKPVGTDVAEVRSLFALAEARGVQLQALYHYAFSTEVMWARRHWAGIREEHGDIVSFESRFLDPKPDLERAARVLTSSWADSGINALSVLARFIELEAIASEAGDSATGRRALVRFRSRATRGTGVIATTWEAREMVKTTRLTLADGTVLALDHAAQRALLDGRSAYEPRVPTSPSTARYRAMLNAYLGPDADGVFDRELSLHLHQLLAQGHRDAASG